MREQMLALGDSISCGEGVGVRVHVAHTWVAALAHALDAELTLLAARGARTHDVRAAQLPVALARPAPIATLLIGLNDISRSGWDPHRVRADLQAVVAALRAVGTTVLLARLHDPTAQLPLPAWLRAQIRGRVDEVNAAVDGVRDPGVLKLDLAQVPELRLRSGWAVDRVHPGIRGHRAIAAAAAGVLEAHGIQTPNRLEVPSLLPAHSRFAEMRWLGRHGAPYLVRNLGRISAPAGDRA